MIALEAKDALNQKSMTRQLNDSYVSEMKSFGFQHSNIDGYFWPGAPAAVVCFVVTVVVVCQSELLVILLKVFSV